MPPFIARDLSHYSILENEIIKDKFVLSISKNLI